MSKRKNLNRATNSRLSVAIVGGGIGGLALAVALAEDSDIRVSVFEAAPTFAEIGAGVSFGPNAVKAIEELGLLATYRQIADSSPAPYEDVWFEWRRITDQSLLCSTLAPGCGQSSVHRADFLDALVERLPTGIAQFGKRCVSIDERQEAVSIGFEDGSTFECDAVIGYDGIKSAVREHVLAEAGERDIGPYWSGMLAYRGLIATDQLIDRFGRVGLERHLALVPQMYLGRDRHILTFPVKKGELTNVVAFAADRSRPDRQLEPDSAWVWDVSPATMFADFPQIGGAPKAVLECIDDPSCWALHTLGELPGYARGRVLLAGDSAHAMVPHQGAGAGQALEDAYVISRLLRDSVCSAANIADVFAVLDACRRPRAERVRRTSLEAGALYQYRGTNIGDDEDRLIAELTSRFDWIWNHDPHESVTAARDMLKRQSAISNGVVP